MATITESRSPQLGNDHSYSLSPVPGPGCEVIWMINGQPVSVHNNVGGLKVEGIGASGVLSVEVTGDTTGTTVSARIECPTKPIEMVGPLVVGGGSLNTCEQEPCKSSREAYADAYSQALSAEFDAWLSCGLYKTAVKFFFTLLLLWVIVFLALIMCQTIHLLPIACQSLYAALTTISLALLAAMIILIIFRRNLAVAQRICRLKEIVMKIAYIKMLMNCPPSCHLPEVKVKCSCS